MNTTAHSFKSGVIVSSILMVNYLSGLVFYPYKTMRRIAEEKDIIQPGFFYVIIYGYFIIASTIRKKTFHPFVISTTAAVSFILFLATFFLTTSFFYLLARILKKSVAYRSLFFTFTYSLTPTLIWFFTTSLLFYFIPPPRTPSFYGQAFSMIFIIFSVTLLLWRLLLFYLSLRFSLKLNFYQVIYYTLLYLLWFVPYSYALYQLKIFRIPFI